MLSNIAVTTLALTTIVTSLPHAGPKKAIISWRSCPDVETQVSESIGLPVPQPLDCATLEVPLDYTDRERGKLELNLVRVNATKEPVLGSVLFNPGGPGGTGVENLPFQAADMHTVLGGQYHLVSWDPRGTGKTIPFDCRLFEEEPLLQRRDDRDKLITVNATERFLNGGWEASNLYADVCLSNQNETGDLIGTAFTARDMVEIVDALGEDGLVRFWGLSYGTQLGNTFAAMFPERVGRMLLDGNMNPHDYQAGHYGNYLYDADKAMVAFFEECLNNKDECALVECTGATTTTQLLDSFNAALAVFASNATADPASFAVYRTMKLGLYSDLYWPVRWPVLAETLTGYLNGSVLAGDDAEPDKALVPYDLGVDSINGIRCSDSLFRASSAEDFLPRVKYQTNLNSSFSDVGFEHTWACAAWKMQAKEQYTGDYTAKTKFPMLFVNGDFDPATPTISAQNASAGFEGSVLLRHSGYGHGIMAHPSVCVAKAVQAYFKDGILPKPGTVCESDLGPWELSEAANTDVESLKKRSSMSDEDANLIRAMTNLGRIQERTMRVRQTVD